MTHVPPRAKIPLSYQQIVFGPFSVSMMPDGLWLDRIDVLSDAIHQFSRYCLPPIPNRTACIMDADGVIVLGYTDNPFADERLQWVGTVGAVKALRDSPLLEPILVTSIEMALES